MQLYYIRHGEPTYNPDQLTEKGHKQAEALGEVLQHHGIDRIFASSSTRARQTAEPLANLTGKEITLLDWCHESLAWEDFTVSEGENKKRWVFQSERCVADFSSDAVYALRDRWADYPTFEDTNCKRGVCRVAAEADAFLAQFGLIRDNESHCYRAENLFDGKVALFAHEGFGHIFLPYVFFMPHPLFARFDIAHTGVTILDFTPYEDGRVFPRLKCVSDTGHLVGKNL